MSELRRRAEKKVSKAALTADSPPDMDKDRLIHEMEIRRIELEMQNDELMRVRNEADALADKYLSLYNFAPVGYFTLNPEGVIIQVNLTGARLLGVHRNELIGKHLAVYLDSGSYPVFTAFLERQFLDEKTESCEVEIIIAEKQPAVVQIQATPSLSARECRLVMIEITRRRKAELALEERTNQLENANRELEKFCYSISHDLQTPLRAIDSYTRMILNHQGKEFNEETIARFKVIRENVHQMGLLISGLLEFARLSKREIATSRVDMDALMKEIWKEMETIHAGLSMTLTINHMPPASGERVLLREALNNLLSNAVKFSKVRGKVIIEAGGERQGTEITYYIRDKGIGFDMAYHDQLFEVFRSLHNPDEYGGTGMGLAITQRIITHHGGRIWAESEAGKGATFYFTLPPPHPSLQTAVKSS
jgi:PAS domain S-box-containing protein